MRSFYSLYLSLNDNFNQRYENEKKYQTTLFQVEVSEVNELTTAASLKLIKNFCAIKKVIFWMILGKSLVNITKALQRLICKKHSFGRPAKFLGLFIK